MTHIRFMHVHKHCSLAYLVWICYVCDDVPKTTLLALSAAFLSSFAFAGDTCPITLIGGTGDATSIAITFENAGKLPIRQLEFNCVPVRTQPHKAEHACREANALFFPGMQYTVNYP